MKPVAARGVTRRFGDFTAVDNVDFEIEPGEVVGLVGANGAGKTTLIRMILGLLEPSAGSIRLFGTVPTRDQRRRIGYVPQNLGLYRDLTAAENLEFRAEVFGSVRTELPAEFDGLVGAMSLGLQRRAAFAAATQHNPELLVLDEPTSGVSPLSRTKLWDMIRQRAEAGAAVLVSTHYMDEAEQADRLVLMSHGKVVAAGLLDDIIGDLSVVAVTADRWDRAFAALDNDDRLITLSGTTVRVLRDSVDDVAAALEAAGVTADMATAPATLDETMVLLDS
ncbi:MAG: ATP-binding cassette domain-containing protein [Acidimicrobiia bacterium]